MSIEALSRLAAVRTEFIGCPHMNAMIVNVYNGGQAMQFI